MATNDEKQAELRKALEEEVRDLQEHSCKRCGFDQRQEYTPVSEEILHDYFKYALAQMPFKYSYELYGGVLKLTFEEATGRLLRLQEQAILEAGREGKGSISDSADYSMAASLVAVRQCLDNGGEKTIYQADLDRRLKILEDRQLPEELLNMPIIQLQALRTTFNQFSRLCASLILAAQDENFWKGVGRN
jgi:hypothetical protein